MPRKVRIEYEGAIYHVMNRGDHREDIFLGEDDRNLFLATLGQACEKTGWQVHAYCLMSNHFHLVVETPRPNLVKGMHWLLGIKQTNKPYPLCFGRVTVSQLAPDNSSLVIVATCYACYGFRYASSRIVLRSVTAPVTLACYAFHSMFTAFVTLLRIQATTSHTHTRPLSPLPQSHSHSHT